MVRLLLVMGFLVSSPAWAVVPESEIIQFLRDELLFPKPELALAVIRVESGCNPKALIYDGGCKCHTYGMMQVQLGTAQDMGFDGSAHQLLNWRINITYGTKYLRSKIEQYNGDIPAALSAYNAGRALTKWTRGKSLRRFTNSEYVRNVLAELGSIVMDPELMRLLNVQKPFNVMWIPTTS